MKRVLLIFAGIIAAISANAQLTLDECHKMARANYPEIKQYDLIGQTKDFTIENIRKAYLPQVTVSAQATLQSAVPTYPSVLKAMMTSQGMSMTGMNKDQYKVQVEASQLIWDGGKSAASAKIARTNATAQTLSADVDLYSVESRINDLYFGILLLDGQIAQVGQTVELLQSNLDKVNSLIKNGAAMQADADAVEAELLTMKQKKIQLESSEATYKQVLSLFIGKDISSESLTKPQYCEPSSFESFRPELAMLNAKMENLSAQKKSIQASTLPTFGLFAQGYYGYPGMDYFKSMMNSDWSFNGIVGVRMQWNVSAFYTKKNAMNQIDAARQMVQVQKNVFLFNNTLQSTQENQSISSLRKVLAEDEKIVDLRKRVREAAESKLRNGVIDSSDLLEKITAENNAAIAKSSREIELLKAAYELKHTVNQ